MPNKRENWKVKYIDYIQSNINLGMYALYIEDITGDGIPDILRAGASSSEMYVLYMSHGEIKELESSPHAFYAPTYALVTDYGGSGERYTYYEYDQDKQEYSADYITLGHNEQPTLDYETVFYQYTRKTDTHLEISKDSYESRLMNLRDTSKEFHMSEGDFYFKEDYIEGILNY